VTSKGVEIDVHHQVSDSLSSLMTFRIPGFPTSRWLGMRAVLRPVGLITDEGVAVGGPVSRFRPQ
jgi:hypothetical protein